MRLVWSRSGQSWAVNAPGLIQRHQSDGIGIGGQGPRTTWQLSRQASSMRLWQCSGRSEGIASSKLTLDQAKGLFEKRVLKLRPAVSPSFFALAIFRKEKLGASGRSSEDGEGAVAICFGCGPKGLHFNGQAAQCDALSLGNKHMTLE